MKEPNTLFDTWLRQLANQALQEGVVTVADIEVLYINVKEAAYKAGHSEGYLLGHEDGYAQGREE